MRQLRLRAASSVALFAILLATVSSPAAASPALAPGVHIDPGSPAAKEYAIPLAQARGGTGSTGKLFGSGITRAPSAPRAGPPGPRPTGLPAATARTQPRAASHHRLATHQPQATQVVELPVPQPSAASRSTGGAAGIMWMLGVAAIVLALGGLGGSALARFSRSASTRTS